MRYVGRTSKTLLLSGFLLLSFLPSSAHDKQLRATESDAATKKVKVAGNLFSAEKGANNASGDVAKSGPNAPSESGTNQSTSLQGRVVTDIDSPEKIIIDLMNSATERDTALKSLDHKTRQYDKGSSRAASKAKDMLNFVTAYKGFERSSEAADIILSEKLKPKSKAAVAYIKQRQQDFYATKIFSALTEMAAGLGTADTQRKDEIVRAAIEHLKPYVGDDSAKSAYDRMKAWSDALPPEALESMKPLDVLDTEKQVTAAVNGALSGDDVVGEIKQRLHKYNGRSNVLRVTAKVVNTTLSVAMFCPNIISPAAQVAYLAFCGATGGPEDAKLLNELYLDQRFQSRWKLYNHTATTAANNYSVGILSKNPVLTQFAKHALDTMTAPAQESTAEADKGTASDSKAEDASAETSSRKTSKRGVHEARKSSKHKTAEKKKRAIADSHLSDVDGRYQ